MIAGLDASLASQGGDPSVAEGQPNSRRWLLLALVLAAGWGAFLSFGAAFLGDEGPLRPGVSVEEADPVRPPRAPFEMPQAAIRPVADRPGPAAPPPVAVASLASAAAEPMPAPVRVWSEPAPAVLEAASPSPPAAPSPSPPAAPSPSPPAAPPAEPAEFVGIWGPTGQACAAPSRRRGYIPATITPEGARAGRTVCRFREGRRSGNGWSMAAECSERGRHWSSQVRLVVDGNRLTWSSAKGASSYVRCVRRSG